MIVRVLSPAIEDVTDAARYYDSQRKGLGSEFCQAVDATLSQIESEPHRFARSEFANVNIDFRFALVPRFRYIIHFAIDIDEVQVVAVAHGARKPGFWLSRARK